MASAIFQAPRLRRSTMFETARTWANGHAAIRQALHERRALHALDLRRKRSHDRGDRSLVAVDGIDGDARSPPAARCSAAMRRRRRIDERRHSAGSRIASMVRNSSSSSAPSSAMLSRTTCTTVPGASARSKLPQTPTFSARSYRVSASARAQPRGRRHHADAGHQHVDIRLEVRPQGGDFALSRSDEQDSHQTSSSLSATTYGCAARLNDDRQAEEHQHRRGNHAEIDADADRRVRRGTHRRAFDDRECLGDGQRAVAGGLRHDPPREKHDAEREQPDDEQRVSRVPAGDQAEQRQDGRDRAETERPRAPGHRERR